MDILEKLDLKLNEGPSGPKWEYYDSRGIKHLGTMQKFSDKGGTDITYFMIDDKTGELSVLSGSLIKKMKRK